MAFFSFIFSFSSASTLGLLLQSQGKVEQREAQALLQESNRSREELKERAQDAVRQWRAKCRRLQRELEETKTGALLHASQVTQVGSEGESDSPATSINIIIMHPNGARIPGH